MGLAEEGLAEGGLAGAGGAAASVAQEGAEGATRASNVAKQVSLPHIGALASSNICHAAWKGQFAFAACKHLLPLTWPAAVAPQDCLIICCSGLKQCCAF